LRLAHRNGALEPEEGSGSRQNGESEQAQQTDSQPFDPSILHETSACMKLNRFLLDQT
jgi:hypothetical protein